MGLGLGAGGLVPSEPKGAFLIAVGHGMRTTHPTDPGIGTGLPVWEFRDFAGPRCAHASKFMMYEVRAVPRTCKSVGWNCWCV